MKELNSCKEAMAKSIESKYFAIAHLYKDEKAMEMHIHDCYEVYFSISGGKQFLIDNKVYDIEKFIEDAKPTPTDDCPAMTAKELKEFKYSIRIKQQLIKILL